MVACIVCNKKFHSADALALHIRDKKDKKHDSFRKDNPNKEKCDHEIHGLFHAIKTKSRIVNKSYLTEDDKILLEKVQKFLEGEREKLKEKCKLENKRLGLPEDTPTNITLKVLREESRKKIEECRRQTKEFKRQSKEFKIQIKESNIKLEQMKSKMKKEGWDAIEKDINERKEKGIPNYIETIPMKSTDKNEYNCPKKCEEKPFKKKGNNTILNMSTG